MSERIIDLVDDDYMVSIEMHGLGNFREEVIRCRDCKWFGPDRSDHEYRSTWWCDLWSNDRVNPDGFCSWAERRKS